MTYATGGTVFRVNNRRVHVFTSNDNLIVTEAGPAHVLVVAGGGGGGRNYDKGSGGGGAGGLIFQPNRTLTVATKAVVIGAGGDGGAKAGGQVGSGVTGSDSTFDGLTAKGGGGTTDSGTDSSNPGLSGGSGGGAGKNSSGGAATQPSQSGDSGTYGKGFAGGSATFAMPGNESGGGGASEVGMNSNDATRPGEGGNGLCEVTVSSVVYNFASIFGSSYGEVSGSNVYFAGGGGGSGRAGGLGGGSDGWDAIAALSNTGGGGGGRAIAIGTVGAAGDGGSGIVIVSYEYNFVNPFGINDCVVWYPMTIGSGTTLNDYKSTNDGTLTNGPTWEKEKTGQYSLKFDGTNDYVNFSTNSIPTGNEMTISVWNFGETAKDSYFIEGTDSHLSQRRTFGIHLPWSDSNVYWDCGNVTTSYDRINKLATSSEYLGWHHWVFTKNAATGIMKIFLDGVEWHSDTGKTRTITTTTYCFLCRGGPLGNVYYHQGRVNNLMIFNRALTENEIKALYKQTYIE
jgi:hypothetical protein